jgi:cytochrome c
MDAWLTSPRSYAPGTKMTFAGLGKAEDRANLMAYLNAQGSNLPLPAAPVAEEAPAEAAEAGTADDEALVEGAEPATATVEAALAQ